MDLEQKNYFPKTSRIPFRTQFGIEFIKSQEIVYFESDGNYSIIHLLNNTKIFSVMSLKKTELFLLGRGFYRVHHKYIINGEHLVRYDKVEVGVTLINSIKLPISRDRKNSIVKLLCSN